MRNHLSILESPAEPGGLDTLGQGEVTLVDIQTTELIPRGSYKDIVGRRHTDLTNVCGDVPLDMGGDIGCNVTVGVERVEVISDLTTDTPVRCEVEMVTDDTWITDSVTGVPCSRNQVNPSRSQSIVGSDLVLTTL